MIRNLSLFLFLITIASCDPVRDSTFVPINHASQDEKTLVYSHSKVIEIDSISLPFYDYFQILEKEGKDWLIGMNRQNVSLDFIPLEDSLPVGHLLFEEDGPGSVSADLDIFHFFTEDSIITIQDRSKKIDVLDRNGALQNTIRTNLKDLQGLEMYPVSYSYLGQWPVFSDSVWVLPVYPDLDVKSKIYYNRNKFVVYDPLRNQVKHEFGAYPDRYKQDRYFDILREPSLTAAAKGSFLVTFPADPGVYEYRLGSDTVHYHQYPDWERFENEGIDRDAAMQEFVNHYISTAWFQQLVYDPYRKVYYRFAKERQELRKADGEKKTAYDADWKVFVLDSYLNPVGEYALDAVRFNPMFSFVSEEGLIIYDNQRDHEDQMVLGVFRLTDK